MGITAALVAAGGAIGLAGIRNPREHDQRGGDRVRPCDEALRRAATQAALDDLSLEIPAGASACSSALGRREDDGAEDGQPADPFDAGDIRIDGRSIRDLPVVELRRGIGYVIQQIGLFPHMTVGRTSAPCRGCSAGRRRGSRAHRRAARARRSRGRRREALPRPALRRPAPARRAGARARGRPTGPADGRAVRRARPDHRHRLQDELPGCSARSARPDLRHARHRRGDQDGRRIAILRQGGVLAQYDTPDAILAHPADDFVAQFIGEDRALRRLALRTLADVALQPNVQDMEPTSGRCADDDASQRRLADARERRRRA